MVFSSHIFAFYFLPVCLLLYYLLPYRARNIFLTIVSYLFYGWWKPWFVSLMMTSTLVDFVAGKVISADGAGPVRRKLALIVSLCTNLGLLAVFKYAMFAQENFNVLIQAFGSEGFEILKITLPIGISFYTFQTMSYTIDVYRGTAQPVRRFVDFSCFVALFPQLIAGPIVRYNTVAKQLAERKHKLERFASGAALFMLGFAKKILLANPVGAIADAAFSAEQPGLLVAWIGAAAFAFQIYFDFSGYSDMAIGLGRMFGFEFPKNFDSPYQAESITDFWRRWHISLSTFLRDYLYFPLGGNRRGARRTYFNLATVMLLGGFWHGAYWQFIVWGAFHGSLLIAERLIGKKSYYANLPRLVRIFLTFILVVISWVPFRAETMSGALSHLGAMFGILSASPGAGLLAGQVFSINSLIVMSVCVFFVSFKTQSWDFVQKLSWTRIATLTGLFVLAIGTMFAQAFNPFLYFQF
jgi:alginate O-acetyltransferase complex protein AlgI